MIEKEVNMISRRRTARICMAAAVALVLWTRLPAGEPPQSVVPASQSLIRVTVDPRVELLSIVFRLAGNSEYNRGRIPSYIKDVDEHFGPFKDHAAVVRARELFKRRGISYDAPMMMAVCLTDIASVELRPCRDAFPLRRDRRWTARDAAALIKDLRSFVRATDFPAFIERHQPLYRTACDRLEQVLRERRISEWFDSFFGSRPQADFIVAIGMLNGGACYGPSVQLADGREEIYSVLGAGAVDEAGQPKFDAAIVSTVVHEFCHSYTNPLVDKHLDALKPSGERIFRVVQAEMKRQAYGQWKTVMTESLVRACGVRYALATGGAAAAAAETKHNTDRHFLWTGGLADLLAEYETSRQMYPTLDVFMPRVVEFFNHYAAERLEKDSAALQEKRRLRLEAIKAKSPGIVSLVPANGAQDVDPNLPAIVVTFDRPMVKGNLAVMRLDLGSLPFAGKSTFDDSGKVLTIPVKLKPQTEYRFGLNAENFLVMRDVQGNPLAPVVVSFKTRAAQ